MRIVTVVLIMELFCIPIPTIAGMQRFSIGTAGMVILPSKQQLCEFDALEVLSGVDCEGRTTSPYRLLCKKKKGDVLSVTEEWIFASSVDDFSSRLLSDEPIDLGGADLPVSVEMPDVLGSHIQWRIAVKEHGLITYVEVRAMTKDADSPICGYKMLGEKRMKLLPHRHDEIMDAIFFRKHFPLRLWDVTVGPKDCATGGFQLCETVKSEIMKTASCYYSSEGKVWRLNRIVFKSDVMPVQKRSACLFKAGDACSDMVLTGQPFKNCSRLEKFNDLPYEKENLYEGTCSLSSGMVYPFFFRKESGGMVLYIEAAGENLIIR